MWNTTADAYRYIELVPLMSVVVFFWLGQVYHFLSILCVLRRLLCADRSVLLLPLLLPSLPFGDLVSFPEKQLGAEGDDGVGRMDTFHRARVCARQTPIILVTFRPGRLTRFC